MAVTGGRGLNRSYYNLQSATSERGVHLQPVWVGRRLAGRQEIREVILGLFRICVRVLSIEIRSSSTLAVAYCVQQAILEYALGFHRASRPLSAAEHSRLVTARRTSPRGGNSQTLYHRLSIVVCPVTPVVQIRNGCPALKETWSVSAESVDAQTVNNVRNRVTSTTSNCFVQNSIGREMNNHAQK